jgi:hypothetical protein
VTKTNRMAVAMLRSSLLWGGLLSLGFYTLIHTINFGGEFLWRYCASHPIVYAETILFFIGMAALVIRWFEVGAQSKLTAKPLLPAAGPTPEPPGVSTRLLHHLGSLSAIKQESYLGQRLRAALLHIGRTGTADGLDEELKYLSEGESIRAQSGYALVMIIVWAIPILGFLGTVVGITDAIGNLSPDALEESLPTVTAGLGVAFDTTALALALSMVLMFTKYQVNKDEERLLAEVDHRASEELAMRFEQRGTNRDPQLMAIARMTESVVEACGQLVERQAEIWQSSLGASQQQLQQSLTAALAQGLEAHAARLAASSEWQAEQNHRYWNQFQQALGESVRDVRTLQTEIVKQGQVFREVLAGMGQLTTLEDALNRNLASLAGSQNFEETLHNLSATINLLNARLSHTQDGPTVRGVRTGQAA